VKLVSPARRWFYRERNMGRSSWLAVVVGFTLVACAGSQEAPPSTATAPPSSAPAVASATPQYLDEANRGAYSRWQAAIEGYVPSVQPGNQLALDKPVRVAFASYLNRVHGQLHPLFTDAFLLSLDELPQWHPLNQANLMVMLEIVLDREGKISRLGVVKPSGVTAFDIAALESVHRTQPFGSPPTEIVSPDGFVYLHWEFYRNPQYACATYFAHPFILHAPAALSPPP
jgi:TonB family protein